MTREKYEKIMDMIIEWGGIKYEKGLWLGAGRDITHEIYGREEELITKLVCAISREVDE